MSCLCVVCVVCVSVWSWSALQFALLDLKIVTIREILHVHQPFVLCCIVCYKRERVCVCVWSWLALQFALQDLKTALIAMLQVYTHRLYGTVWYTASVCACVCVRARRKAPIGVEHALSCLTDQLTRIEHSGLL